MEMLEHQMDQVEKIKEKQKAFPWVLLLQTRQICKQVHKIPLKFIKFKENTGNVTPPKRWNYIQEVPSFQHLDMKYTDWTKRRKHKKPLHFSPEITWRWFWLSFFEWRLFLCLETHFPWISWKRRRVRLTLNCNIRKLNTHSHYRSSIREPTFSTVSVQQTKDTLILSLHFCVKIFLWTSLSKYLWVGSCWLLVVSLNQY